MDVKKIDWVATPGHLIAHDHDAEIVRGVGLRWQARTIADGTPIGYRRKTVAAAKSEVTHWLNTRQGQS